MSVLVQLPPVLRSVSGGERSLCADGGSIGAVLGDLTRKHPTLALHLFDEAGAIRHNIVFLYAGAVIRAKDAAVHRLNSGDEIIITNALAGG